MVQYLSHQIEKHALVCPEKAALAFKEEVVSYADTARRMRLAAGRLMEAGVQPGDRVMLCALSRPDVVIAYLALSLIHAVTVFVDKNATPATTAFIWKDTEAVLYLVDKPLKGEAAVCRTASIRALCQDGEEKPLPELGAMDPEELTEMIYTSGTTGQPKGVMLTRRAVWHILQNTILGTKISGEDRVLLPLPLNHSFALRVLRAVLFAGGMVVLQNGFTFAREIENNLDRHGCDSIAIVPASVETITRQMQGRFTEIMGRFARIEVSAGSLTVEQRLRLTAELPKTQIYNTWGSSESGGAIFLDVNAAAADPVRVSALGRPIEGVEVMILDEDGTPFESSPAHPGRMMLRGAMQMKGYWNRPELNEKTLKDGWLVTGDLVYLADGFVYMLGRADDIINVGGEKVSPVEVENTAGQYPGIAECACLGVPDPEGILGSVPVLFVVPHGGAFSEEELTKFLAARLEKFKIPVKYVLQAQLPRNAMQKIDRKALKILWEEEANGIGINEMTRMLLTRRSVRRFTDQPIPRRLLEILVTAGYHAPSGHNMQTWRFTVIRNRSEIARLKQAAQETAKASGVYFYGFEDPTALILVSNDSRNVYGCQDASCATENIMLAAWSYGLGSVWLNPLMTLRHVQPVESLLDSYGIPAGHTVWSMIALGYPAAEGAKLQKKESVVYWIE